MPPTAMGLLEELRYTAQRPALALFLYVTVTPRGDVRSPTWMPDTDWVMLDLSCGALAGLTHWQAPFQGSFEDRLALAESRKSFTASGDDHGTALTSRSSIFCRYHALVILVGVGGVSNEVQSGIWLFGLKEGEGQDV